MSNPDDSHPFVAAVGCGFLLVLGAFWGPIQNGWNPAMWPPIGSILFFVGLFGEAILLFVKVMGLAPFGGGRGDDIVPGVPISPHIEDNGDDLR